MRGPATGASAFVKRHLLADDRLHIAVEANTKAFRCRRNVSPAGVNGKPPGCLGTSAEPQQAHEAEHGVDAAVVEKAEATDLIA